MNIWASASVNSDRIKGNAARPYICIGPPTHVADPFLRSIIHDAITSNEPANELTHARAEKRQSQRRENVKMVRIWKMWWSEWNRVLRKSGLKEERRYEEERENGIMEKEQEHGAKMMGLLMQCVQHILGHGSWTTTSIPAPWHQYGSKHYVHTQIPTGHDQVQLQAAVVTIVYSHLLTCRISYYNYSKWVNLMNNERVMHEQANC